MRTELQYLSWELQINECQLTAYSMLFAANREL